MARLSEPGEVCCNAGGDYRCPNVAEFLVELRNGSHPQWVCGKHVHWWGRSQVVLARASTENPPTETDTMAHKWGSPEESNAAWNSIASGFLAQGHTMFMNGVWVHPDGRTSASRFRPDDWP